MPIILRKTISIFFQIKSSIVFCSKKFIEKAVEIGIADFLPAGIYF